MWDLSSLARDQTPCPLHWQLKVLTTGPPGKSPKFSAEIVPSLRGILMPAINNRYDYTFITYVYVYEWIFFFPTKCSERATAWKGLQSFSNSSD